MANKLANAHHLICAMQNRAFTPPCRLSRSRIFGADSERAKGQLGPVSS
jgi:hypothetical protein